MVGQSFFIAPDGALIAADERHIKTVIENPETFGYTKEQIEDIHKKHNEPLGAEGNAREEILKDLINNGWSRVRKYESRSGEFWSIQVPKMTKRMEDKIHNVAEKIADKTLHRRGSLYDELRINDFSNGEVYTVTVKDILDGKFYSQLFDETKKQTEPNLIEVLTIQEYTESRKIMNIGEYKTLVESNKMKWKSQFK